MFGTDMFVGTATCDQALTHAAKDDAIFGELRIDEKQCESYYRKALQRFLFGVSPA